MFFKDYSSREEIGKIDDSFMLSSMTSMMDQFYIEHRKHDDSLMLH